MNSGMRMFYMETVEIGVSWDEDKLLLSKTISFHLDRRIIFPVTIIKSCGNAVKFIFLDLV